MSQLILPVIIIIPIVSSFILAFVKKTNVKLIRDIGLYTCLVVFFFSAILWVQFDSFVFKFQFLTKIILLNFLNVNFFIGVDGVSLLFIVLTTLIFPICILFSWNNINFFLKNTLYYFY